MNPMSMPDADFPEDDDMDAPRYSRIVFDPTSHHASAPHSHSHSHSHSHIMTSSGSTRDLRDVTTSHLPQPHLMSSYSPMCTLPSSMQPGMPSLPAPGMPSLPAPGMQHAAMIPSHALYTPRHSLSSARHDSVVYPFRTGIDERNPVYSSSQFRQYRNRQEQRPEKDTAIWPPELENPFLDALLLIPIMGRKKYFMRRQQYGRNMLIGDYVWIAYVSSLPSGVTPDEKNMKRTRKQISSHIQVLKNFFKYHRYFHFFFPARDKETGKKVVGTPDIDTVETVSLKNNPVLVALSESRFPDVRPNYQYFADLLNQDNLVSIRPKACSIYVSSHDVCIGQDRVARTRDGMPLNLENYPQLAQNLESDMNRIQSTPGTGTVLHSYTNAIGQKESDTLKDLVRGWEKIAPEVVRELKLPEPQDEAHLTIIEMSVTMELHRMPFATRADLNCMVQMGISAAGLYGHHWRCTTYLSCPKELHNTGDGNSSSIFTSTEIIGQQYAHKQNCGEGLSHCTCTPELQHDIKVPFPMGPWADILLNAAKYASHDQDSRGDESTAEQLFSKIVMFQELKSAPAYAPMENQAMWGRRALIMWRFNGMFKPLGNSMRHDVSPSTSWRFLTVNDPTSDYHQQRAYVNTGGHGCTGGNPFHRDPMMPPSPSSIHRTSTVATTTTNTMHAGMASVWPQAAPLMRSMGSVSSHGSMETSSDVLSSSLATPPPQSATVYPSTFGTGSFLQPGLGSQVDPSGGGAAAAAAAADIANDGGYLSSVQPGFSGSVCAPGIVGWEVNPSLDWSQQSAGTGSASPYEPTLVDKAGNVWSENAREAAAQGFWSTDPKTMWTSTAPQSVMTAATGTHQPWAVRNPWEEVQRTQSFDKVSEATSPMSSALGKRRRDGGSDMDESVSVSTSEYQRKVRAGHRDSHGSAYDPPSDW